MLMGQCHTMFDLYLYRFLKKQIKNLNFKKIFLITTYLNHQHLLTLEG